jgi:hypothetical protein
MLILFSYKGSTQCHVNALLRHCSDVHSDLELRVEDSEEGCIDEVTVVPSFDIKVNISIIQSYGRGTGYYCSLLLHVFIANNTLQVLTIELILSTHVMEVKKG